MSTNLLHHFFPQPSSSSSTPFAQHTPSSTMPPPPPDDMGSSVIPDPEDDVPDEENIFRDMTFDEILEDLNARFLVNLPKEESSLVRVYWQAEQAHWFYEDYLRPLNPLLPSMSQRNFTHLIIASSPLYSELNSDDYDAVWEEYCRYKRMVPCCGGILFNTTGDKVLMVRGWKSNAGWCFPRGKINSEESEEACAIREVEEETGFDLSGRIVSRNRIQTQIAAQTVTMFLVGDIDESTIFQTQTRKEIGAIEWVHVSDLPTWSNKKGPKTTTNKGKKKFYNVTPFVGAMKKWLTDHGYPVHPKRRQAQALQPNPGQRSLEPYHFEGSPMPSPQPTPAKHDPQPTHTRDQTALDNLFHRFVHKQEEEQSTSAGKENQAGIERLFGNLDVLRQEDEAKPSGRNEQEEREDDALAKLLGGLSTTTPAPRAPDLAPSAKASKLLAVINAPTLSATSTEPSKPHQASLLAMLSPKQGQPAMAERNKVTGNLFPNQGKPMSLPTSPRPPSPSQEERTRKQRALLEQITAGFGIDVPSNIPPPRQSLAQYGNHTHTAQPGSQIVSRDRSRESSVNPQHARQTSAQRISPNGLPFPHATAQRTSGQGYSPSKDPSLVSRAPPPPYDSLNGGGMSHGFHQHQVSHQAPHQAVPSQFLPPLPMATGPMHPTQSLPLPGPPSEHLPHFDYRQQPIPPPQQRQNLLNLLRSAQPPAGPNQVRPKQGPMQGYRPAPQPFPSAQQTNVPPGPLPPHVSNQGGPQMFSMNPHPHPLPIRPQAHMPNPAAQHGNYTFPAQGGPPPPHPPSSGHHTMNHHFDSGFPGLPGGFGTADIANQQFGHVGGPGNSAGVSIPILGGNPIGSTVYHHPVPRPPNSQAGTLLSMLNDDTSAEGKESIEKKKRYYASAPKHMA